jgi:hypothetical protein
MRVLQGGLNLPSITDFRRRSRPIAELAGPGSAVRQFRKKSDINNAWLQKQ